MNCSNPIDAAVLADYWLAALSGPEEEAVEEHLFECDRCGARLREVIALAEGIQDLARRGCLRMVVSDGFVQRAAAQGLRVRQYAPPPGGSVECTVTADEDLCICDERGVELRRLPDIPMYCGASHVLYQESMTFAQAAPTSTLIMRLMGFDETGGESVLGEYTFHHTRTLPG